MVRAVETTRSLGRLYRRSGRPGHAAELAAPSRPDPAGRAAAARLHRAARTSLVREVARRTGRTEDDVVALLGPAGVVPSSDRDLITLARQLAELDREVRRT